VIVKSGTDQPYTQIANQAINDTHLSNNALAALTYLMSRPSGWHVYATQIAKRFGCTRKTAQIYLNELINAGYAQRRDQQRRDGKTAYDYDVSDNPDNINSGSFLHTNNNTSLIINTQVKQCLSELQQYMSMYRLMPSEPIQSIKREIRQIVNAGITPRVFALYAIDWMHDALAGSLINIRGFIEDAVGTLTYDDSPKHTGTYDDCEID
jgi:predicted transcriptional regulator